MQVVQERDGVWPNTLRDCKSYRALARTATGAVACFAFNKAVPLVDTNVARVYARRDGLALPLNKKKICGLMRRYRYILNGL